MSYAANKLWRERHPAQRRADRTAYYKSHERKRAGKDRYTREDFLLAITKQLDGRIIPDRVIAQQLNRSIRSLHVLRAKVSNGYGPQYARQWLSDGTPTMSSPQDSHLTVPMLVVNVPFN